MKNGEPDLAACDSLENGVITLHNHIKTKVNADLDMLLGESDIDAVLKEQAAEYDDTRYPYYL